MRAVASSAALTERACPEYPTSVRTLVDVLDFQARHMPDRSICHRVTRGRQGLSAEPLSVTELVDRSKRAAGALRRAGVVEGSRVIVSLSDPHDFLVAFFGALRCGAAAVPLPTVMEAGAPRSFEARVRSVCGDCSPAAAVVEAAKPFEATVPNLAGAMAILEPADLLSAGVAELDLPEQFPNSAAFIQYTSGSTGTPKGAVITHRNILANCRAIRDATEYTRDDRMVSWLPLHHDMGLIGGLLTSIYCAAETWLMRPIEFLGRPATWLESITAFAATLTVAPTFAYSLCARKLPAKQLEKLDLSSLRLAYVGAEPVDAATLEAFVERFRPYGLSPTAMYPVYGLAEATLAVAFPRAGSAVRIDCVDRNQLAADAIASPISPGDPNAVRFVSVGHALPEHQIAIVDPSSHRALADRCVGEVVAIGPSIAPGYLGDPLALGERALHTGDLGYAAEGHVFVIDRIKDLVIIAGQNYSPSDIETAVAAVAGLRRGRIVGFALPSASGGEQLHLVAEASFGGWRSPAELKDEVVKTLRRDIGLSPATVTIVPPGSLERTSSGKLKRRSCIEAFQAGRLKAIETRRDWLQLWLWTSLRNSRRRWLPSLKR